MCLAVDRRRSIAGGFAPLAIARPQLLAGQYHPTGPRLVDVDRVPYQIDVTGADYQVAIHEAGHAVVGHALGLSIELLQIWVSGAGPLRGKVRWDDLRNPSNRGYRAYIATSVAGCVADSIFQERRFSLLGLLENYSLDSELATKSLDQLRPQPSPEQGNRILWEEVRHAREILEPRWRTVTTLSPPRDRVPERCRAFGAGDRDPRADGAVVATGVSSSASRMKSP